MTALVWQKAVFDEFGQPIGPPLAGWTAPDFPPRRPMLGRFCHLQPLDAALHAQELYAAFALDQEGRNWTYLPYGPFDSLPALQAWMAPLCQGDDPRFFAIVDKATGKAVGVASYCCIDPAGGSIEVGHIHYAALLKRTPAATEAMYLMMERVFALGYRRYEWKCDALNVASRVAAQRLGFLYEGTFRQATVYKGRSRDTAWFAIIDTDWPALRRAFQAWLAPDNFDERGAQRRRLADIRRPFLWRYVRYPPRCCASCSA